MMFGREENFPVDNRFGNRGVTEGDWIYETRRNMREVQILVGGRVDREKCNGEQEVDELEKCWQVRVRNRVLGRRKLANIWGDISWTVEVNFNDSSAYILSHGETRRVENRRNLKRIEKGPIYVQI